MNVSNIIKPHMTENPGKTAMIFGDRRISYAELDTLVNRTAGGITKMGFKRGDVLSVFLPSIPELVIAYLGTVRAGVTLNLVNAMLQKIEVAYILNDCRSRGILTDAKRLPIIESLRSEVASLSDVILLEEQAGSEYPSLEAMLAEGGGGFRAPETQGSDLCHLMYTSGTTGRPKGVMATHQNIWHNATEFGKVHFTPADTLMVATPIFHCWGLVNGTFGMLSTGGTVITVERFYPDQALNDIEQLRPTVFIGVPPMYNLLLNQPDLDSRDISSVVFCLSAATKMPENLIRQVEQRLKWRYAEAWGLTEVSCVGATSPYTETRIGSCGRGMGDAIMKVIDENGTALPPHHTGELCVKGTCVTNGYLNKPDATRRGV